MLEKGKVTLKDLDKFIGKSGSGKVGIYPILTIAEVDKEIAKGVKTKVLFTHNRIVTPTVAQHILDTYNQKNSRIQLSSIDTYATHMAEKQWVLSADPISFIWDGLLGSGQHRLMACVRSGCNFVTTLAYGVDPEMRKYRNSGKRDKAHDYLVLEDWPNAKETGATMRWIGLYHEHKGATTGRSTIAPTLYLSYAKTFDRESLIHCVKIGKTIHKDIKGIPAQYLAAVYYVARKIDKIEADKFFEKWAEGRPYKAAEAAQRAFMAFNAIPGNKSGKEWDKMAMLILMWNNYYTKGKRASQKDLRSWNVTKPVPVMSGDDK